MENGENNQESSVSEQILSAMEKEKSFHFREAEPEFVENEALKKPVFFKKEVLESDKEKKLVRDKIKEIIKKIGWLIDRLFREFSTGSKKSGREVASIDVSGETWTVSTSGKEINIRRRYTSEGKTEWQYRSISVSCGDRQEAKKFQKPEKFNELLKELGKKLGWSEEGAQKKAG